MSLPKPFLDELRARIPLSDVVGKRVRLTRAGREFKGCCPFHKEKTPSFYVNDQKGFYHCFGCGAHGDAIRFLTDHDNMKFMDAVEQLAGVAGLSVPKPTPEEAQRFQRQMSLYDLMESASRWFEAQLAKPENRKILHYLLERGLQPEVIRSFRLGFAPSEADGLRQHLLHAGFRADDMEEVGLIRKSDRRAGEFYGFFRDRVMFPVTDLQGRIVAFGGRVLPGADKSAPKYVNSPESPIFHKGRNLYALSRARKPIGDGEAALVVEGYMDVIALHQAGFRGAVAPLGTALTESQVEELWKAMPEAAKTPVLCFDGDAAGQRAAARALERVMPILKPDHSVRFAFLPEGEDPDSLIKKEGRGAMERVLSEGADLLGMLWSEEAKGRDLSRPEARAGLKSALTKRARSIADSSVQEFFIYEINQRIKEVFLTKKSEEYRGALKGAGRFGRREAPGAHTPYRSEGQKVRPLRSSKFLREKILIAAMINYPELYDEFAEAFGMMETDSQDYDKLRQSLISLYDAQNGLDYQAVKQHLIDSGLAETLDAIFDQSLYLHAGFAKPGQPYDVVRQGWQDAYERGAGHAARQL